MGAVFAKGVSVSVCVDVNASPEILWSTISDIKGIPNYLSFVKSVSIINKDKSSSITNTSTSIRQDNIDDDENDIDMSDYVLNEGLAWKETRTYKGKDHYLMKSITSIESKIIDIFNENTSKEEKHRQQSVRIHVTFPTKSVLKLKIPHIVNTSTLIVDSLVNDTTIITNTTSSTDTDNNDNINVQNCTLIGTMAVIPSSFLFQFSLILFGKKNIDEKISKMYQDELNQTKIEAEKRYINLIQQQQLHEQEKQQNNIKEN